EPFPEELTKMENLLLRYLFSRQGEVVSKEDAVRATWGKSNVSFFKIRSADVYVTRLRKMLRADPSIRLEKVGETAWRLTIGDEGEPGLPVEFAPDLIKPPTVGNHADHPANRSSFG